MAEANGRRISTDYAVPPGETLAEVLEERNMSQADLARRTGRPLKTINEIVKGKAAITASTAIQLERALSISATYWNNLEANYREDLARMEERKELELHVPWLKRFPVKDMLKQGLIKETKDKVAQVGELLTFFGVSNPDAWQRQQTLLEAQFRQSTAFPISDEALAVWLREGELEAQEIECKPFDGASFEEALTQARPLTREDPKVFVPALRTLCSEAGVAIAFVPELPRTRVSGAARWLTPEKALIELSLRYKRDDTLWFSFFHEAGHILLHGRRRGHLDTDRGTSSATPAEESEADHFASDFLIPPKEYEQIISGCEDSPTVIESIAEQLGIAPGILVGRLQHDGVLPWNAASNRLRRPLRWANEATDD